MRQSESRARRPTEWKVGIINSLEGIRPVYQNFGPLITVHTSQCVVAKHGIPHPVRPTLPSRTPPLRSPEPPFVLFLQQSTY